ncbi:MAG: hypothetical protein FWF86_08270 [Clostridia bacterium]|nr:hypothetical protein [Clostridia bacterium]
MRSILPKRLLPLILCLVLPALCRVPAAYGAKRPQTAEALGYLPAAQLLEADGRTVKFNDPAVEKALKEEYPHLMDEEGRFTKKSLVQVRHLSISDDFPGKVDEDDPGYPEYLEAQARIRKRAKEDLSFTPKLPAVDLSALQFCTKLRWLDVYAVHISSLPVLRNCRSLRSLGLVGAKSLSLDPLPSLRIQDLYLLGCEVADYQPLTRCDWLWTLGIKSDTLQDIAFVTRIPQRRRLVLDIHAAPNIDPAPFLETKRSVGGICLDMDGRAKDDVLWQLLTQCAYRFSLYNATEWNEKILNEVLPEMDWLDLHYRETPAVPADFSFLREAKSLSVLNMESANVASLSFLTELPGVDWVGINNSHIADATGVFAPRYRCGLFLTNSTVEDWGSFAEPVKVKKWYDTMQTNVDLTSLSFTGAPAFTSLNAPKNDASDIPPLALARWRNQLAPYARTHWQ